MARFAHGLVLGKFYPLHAGHSALIRRAATDCERVTVLLLGSIVESIPLAVREAWIREEHPDVTVTAAYDEHPVDFDDPVAWELPMAVINELLDGPVDAVHTSDPYGRELARRLDAAWVQVDPGRLAVPVSGRAVRADPPAYWWALAPCVRAWFCRRVVVLGAESTGTTTLAAQLAEHYGAPCVPEYGQTWSEERPGGLDAPWESWEFDHVARWKAELEDAAARTAPRSLIICDTDVLATTVWHERYVGSASPSVVALAESRRPALYHQAPVSSWSALVHERLSPVLQLVVDHVVAVKLAGLISDPDPELRCVRAALTSQRLGKDRLFPRQPRSSHKPGRLAESRR